MKILMELRRKLEEKFPGIDFTPYFTFIESKSVLTKGGHRHHILPTKEFPDLRKDFNNRIRLTSGDHLRAHYWLALCVPECDSFQRTFFIMTKRKFARDIREENLPGYVEVYERGAEKSLEQARELGRWAVESGHLAKAREGVFSQEHQRAAVLCRSKESLISAGRLGGAWAVESGQLASFRTPEHQAKAGKIGGRIGGRKAGQKNVESGHIQRLGRLTTHNRYHRDRRIVKMECELCKTAMGVL